jgi:regulator of sirC expression with transglutaminase-like and TPR domain
MRMSEIRALIQLLDDPNEDVYQHVRKELIDRGPDILPVLTAEQTGGLASSVHRTRLEELVRGMHMGHIQSGLETWKSESENTQQSLFEGALWVHKGFDAGFDTGAVRESFAKMRRDAWLELNEELTALEQIRVLNHMFSTVWGFSAAKHAQPSPEDALVGHIMKDRVGNPIGLGVVYLAWAQELELPVYGVKLPNLPSHFLLAYQDPSHVHEDGFSVPGQGILFYINPFQGGEIIAPEEVASLLSETPGQQHVEISTSREVLRRMISNIAYSCATLDLREGAERMRLLRSGLCEPTSEPS